MITDGGKWHYHAAKNVPGLVEGKYQIIREIFSV